MSQGNLNLGQIQRFVVPLPPLAEQQRIVAKVEELMRWCDHLETHLATAQAAGSALLDATLRQLLAA
jgi:type I restriction enzyme S subunit